MSVYTCLQKVQTCQLWPFLWVRAEKLLGFPFGNKRTKAPRRWPSAQGLSCHGCGGVRRGWAVHWGHFLAEEQPENVPDHWCCMCGMSIFLLKTGMKISRLPSCPAPVWCALLIGQCFPAPIFPGKCREWTPGGAEGWGGLRGAWVRVSCPWGKGPAGSRQVDRKTQGL